MKYFDSYRLSRIAKSVTHIYGPTRIDYDKNEAIVLCLVKDGEYWIRDFITHYQTKGFKHIVFLDNGSIDNTLQISAEHSDVTILKTDIPFKGNNILLRRYLINRFAKNRWSLTADIDELWDYPFSDKIKLGDLLQYLTARGANAVIGQMLDMFLPAIPNRMQPLESYNLYDISQVKKDALNMPYGFKSCGLRFEQRLNNNIKFHRGGIRAQVFGLERIWLTKMPLVFYDETVKPVTHQHFSNHATIADISTVLLHYKLIHGFNEQTVKAVEQEQYFSNSCDYKQYLSVLTENPSLNLKSSTAKRLESVNQLIDDGFLVVSGDFIKFVSSHSDKENGNDTTGPAR